MTRTADEFLAFIEMAEPLLLPRVKSATLSTFQKFVDAAKPVLTWRAQAAATAMTAFEKFLAVAVPLTVAKIKSSLPELAERAAVAARWFVRERDDLLQVAGFSFVEDAYTELTAWALHPETHLRLRFNDSVHGCRP